MSKIFTVGPVEMFPQTLEVRSRQVPYFRTEDFSKMMLNADEGLHKLLAVDETYKTIYLTASGTGAMEATIMNCLDKSDKILVINGGSFGSRFAKMCKIHDLNYDELIVPFEADLSEGMLNPFDGKGYTACLVNIHETSIGKLYDMDILSEFCKKNDMFLVVDAISSFLCDRIKLKEWGVDAFIFSSQKAMALAPGMSNVVLSPRMLSKMKTIEAKTMYFDFKDYLYNFERGQTPFTPCVGVFLEYADMINFLNEIGMDTILAEKKHMADLFRKLAEDNNLWIPQFNKSNALTTLLFDKDAYDVFIKLKNNYGLLVTPNGGELKDRVLRIGHMGNLKEEDYVCLLKALKQVLAER